MRTRVQFSSGVHQQGERAGRLEKGSPRKWCHSAAPRWASEARYRVIVDRISHEVEYYRGYLKHAVLQGTYVINNPFWWTADDKFFNYSVAAKVGLAIPKTILLPRNRIPPMWI